MYPAYVRRVVSSSSAVRSHSASAWRSGTEAVGRAVAVGVRLKPREHLLRPSGGPPGRCP